MRAMRRQRATYFTTATVRSQSLINEEWTVTRPMLRSCLIAASAAPNDHSGLCARIDSVTAMFLNRQRRKSC